MSGNNLYVIDTSSLVTMKFAYRNTVFPSLWKNVDQLIVDGRIIAPIQVLDELHRKDDKVYRWAQDHKNANRLFRTMNEDIQKALEIMQNPDFKRLLKKNIPGEQADPYVIAVGYNQKYGAQQPVSSFDDVIVITEEFYQPDVVKIPYVCRKLKLTCSTLIDVVENEGWQF
jgi:hypothetical protein